ncbi:sigma-70 family RNA polymerase sigma factor [Leptolyngbya sp. 15MV]|nr:sigma-70 family RNA polymerase sigma factor [Leptolyngbya sp. 15MV]
MTQHRSATAPAPEALYDALLVTMTMAGDRRAAGRLHARWQPRLLRTARRHTGDGELAAQAAQECWLAIWRGLPRLRDADRFAPWAFGILRRRCADIITVRARDRASEAAADEPCATSAPDDAIALRQAFATLAPPGRLTAHLHFVEGLTLAEIAEVQQVPEGTVKSRLFHIRRQLRAALSGDDQ